MLGGSEIWCSPGVHSQSRNILLISVRRRVSRMTQKKLKRIAGIQVLFMEILTTKTFNLKNYFHLKNVFTQLKILIKSLMGSKQEVE